MIHITKKPRPSISTCIKSIGLYIDYTDLIAQERLFNTTEVFAALPRYYFLSKLELKHGYGSNYISARLKEIEALLNRHNLTVVDLQNEISRDRIIELLRNGK